MKARTYHPDTIHQMDVIALTDAWKATKSEIAEDAIFQGQFLVDRVQMLVGRMKDIGEPHITGTRVIPVQLVPKFKRATIEAMQFLRDKNGDYKIEYANCIRILQDEIIPKL